jgi:spermidine/putrescine transport system permease protein
MTQFQLLEPHRPTPPAFLHVIMWSAFSLLFLPLLTVIILSFIEPSRDGTTDFQWSLVWYQRLLENEKIGQTLLRSILIAGSVAVCSGVVGTCGAIAFSRGRFWGLGVLKVLAMFPVVLPELVLGLSSLLWFVVLRLSLGMHSIVLAHVTFTVTYVLVVVLARLQGLDQSLEEAAADLGASYWQTLFKVIWPSISTSVAAGMMIAFVLSFDDFMISFFTTGVESDTLPLMLYSMIRFGINREIYALSTLLVTMTFLVVIVFRKTILRTNLTV